MSKKQNPAGQRRLISISVCHPVTAKITVFRPDEDSDWEIESVRDVTCDASVRSLTESMSDDEYDEMIRRADAANDVDL